MVKIMAKNNRNIFQLQTKDGEFITLKGVAEISDSQWKKLQEHPDVKAGRVYAVKLKKVLKEEYVKMDDGGPDAVDETSVVDTPPVPEHVCSECEEPFKTKAALTRHMKEKHTDTVPK